MYIHTYKVTTQRLPSLHELLQSALTADKKDEVCGITERTNMDEQQQAITVSWPPRKRNTVIILPKTQQAKLVTTLCSQKLPHFLKVFSK